MRGRTMSGQPAKRQETSARVSAIVSLPPELLETIFGFLGVRTLLTARLVCAQFRSVASSRLRSVELSVETLRSRPETHLNNFPNLGRVTVFDAKEYDLLMLAQSPIAAAVTHVRAVEFLRPVRAVVTRARTAAGSTEPPLPNLMSLTVRCARGGPAFPLPHTLRELALDCPVNVRTWNFVPGLSNLTCLRFDAPDFSPRRLEAVTALTGLQRLDICSSFLVAPFLAELTLLTHLQFQGKWGRFEVIDLGPLASLSRLHRLVHLGVKHIPNVRERHWPPFRAALERQVLGGVATLTRLRSLDLELCRRPQRSAFETVCMTPFSQLTALRLEGSNGLRGDRDNFHASFLPRFNLERLRDLALSKGVDLDRDGVAALRQATGLTHLSLWTATVGPRVGPEKWTKALSSMSRLRALFLGVEGTSQATSDAIQPLTKLTRLTLSGRGVTTNTAVQACLGLEKLRVLSLSVSSSAWPYNPITSETLFAIAKLRRLREFNVTGSYWILGGDLPDITRARIHAIRREKGWPPLELNVSRGGS